MTNESPPKRRTWLIPTYIAGGLLIADFIVGALPATSPLAALRPFLLGGGIVALVIAGYLSIRKS